MSETFYSHARLYDPMFPGGGPAVGFYRAEALRKANERGVPTCAGPGR